MIDSNDRREINEALSEALNGSRTPDANSVRRFLAALGAAHAMGRTWPDELREEVLREWVYARQKQIAKEESRVLIDYKGRKVGKSTRVGRKVTDRDGGTHYQQTLLTQMTWDEIADWERMIEVQIDGLESNRAMAAKLRQLQDRFPESDGPAEAAAALGITVEEWLAS